MQQLLPAAVKFVVAVLFNVETWLDAAMAVQAGPHLGGLCVDLVVVAQRT